MLQTKYKDKLPSFLTYPLGAKTISESLIGVPQYDKLEIGFLRGRYEKLEREGRRKVAAVRYLRSNLGLSAAHFAEERGYYGPKWSIDVYAVPRDSGSTVRDALASAGFALLRDWLAESRTELWLSSSHSRTLWLEISTMQLVAEEGNS